MSVTSFTAFELDVRSITSALAELWKARENKIKALRFKRYEMHNFYGGLYCTLKAANKTSNHLILLSDQLLINLRFINSALHLIISWRVWMESFGM